MSSNTITIQKGKRYSFFQLFKEQNYVIEIPIIQRDYAQGRKSKSEVRDLFLSALFDYLEENIPNRDLDFVYGSTEINNKIEKFIPLDGQQRLTTLFLLHWYLANISRNKEKLKSILFDNKNSKFTYLTRTSSSEFCDALFENEIDFNNLLTNKKTKKESLAETIKDSWWYFLSWGKDPTIQSMLIMLDAIHDKFKNKPDFYDRIVDNTNPIITFLYLDLGEFGLTEDLYIKMNSRGKPLTTFENFKAKLEQHISGVLPDSKLSYNMLYDKVKKQVSAKEYFSFNIDTKWANLFWQYRELAGNKNTFDDEIMNFIYVLALNHFAKENDYNKEIFQYLSKSEPVDLEIIEYISFNKLHSINALPGNFISYLIDAFDNLSNGNNKIKIYLEDKFYYDENEMFRKALSNKLSWTDRIKFHAYISFLIFNKEDRSGLHQWMRVVHNLAENTAINGAEEVVKAIKSLENILSHSNNILDYLCNDQNKIESFYSRQSQEEKIKACLLLKDERWKSSIEHFETRAFFKGQLGFILEFSGILEYYESNLNCNWSDSINKVYFDVFSNYATKASSAFEIIDTDKNVDYVLERAVLTKGNYLIKAGWDKYNFLSTTKDLRDYSWKKLLRLPQVGESSAESWKEKRHYVKDLFDDNKFDPANIVDSLSEICEDQPNDWRKYFITQPELIKYCQQGFIQFNSENDIYLVWQFQDNSKKREMYTYNLFLDEYENSFEPFGDFCHVEINRENEESYMLLYDWCYDRKHYSIKIYREENENALDGHFLIVFQKSKGEKKLTDYNDSIVSLLEENKFKWNDEWFDFRINRKNETTTIAFIKDLCKSLSSL